jgi:CheY-like chemotaxis protein
MPVDAVRRALADAGGDALCNVCLAIACRTSLSNMRRTTTALVEQQSVARRTRCARCGREVLAFVTIVGVGRTAPASDRAIRVLHEQLQRSQDLITVSREHCRRSRDVIADLRSDSTREPSLIAVVDDDASVRRAVARLLSAVGYRVQTFASGRELLDSPAAHTSSCLVLDVRMPGMSGVAVYDALKAAGARVPVLFITGDCEVPETTRVSTGSLVTVLSKPVDDDKLFETVQRLITARDAECVVSS